MPFTPRTLPNGEICCSSEDALCDACKAELRRQRIGLRASADRPCLDPYAAALAKRRGETVELTPDLDPRYSRTHPPDGYAIAIALQRAKREHEEDR